MTKLLEHFKIAFGAIWANKARSLLTMLGVIIGVFAVVELLAAGEGMKSAISKEIENLGSNILVIVPGKVGGNQYNAAATIGVSTLTVDDVKMLRERVSEIESISPIMLISSPVRYQEKEIISSLVLGVQEHFFRSRGVPVNRGTLFAEKDQKERKRVVVLGDPVARELFGEDDPLTKMIMIRGEAFEVIGVLEKPKESTFSFGGPNFDQAIYLPFETGEELTRTSQVFRIFMKVKSGTDIPSLKTVVKTAMIENHQGSEDFTVFSQEDLVGLISSILDIMRALLGSLGAISLLVGGIGIMNMMLVSVTERTREIGIRKAIGASSFDILIQFLIESMVLSLLGGCTGIGFSVVVARVASFKAPFDFVVTPESILLAVGFSLGVGVLFGIAPAVRAAKKEPIQALRYE